MFRLDAQRRMKGGKAVVRSPNLGPVYWASGQSSGQVVANDAGGEEPLLPPDHLARHSRGVASGS